MHLSQQELDTHLTNHLASIYLIAGDELPLVDSAAKAIRHCAEKQGYDEYIKLILAKDTDPVSVERHTMNSSLFSRKRIVEIRIYETQLLNQFNGVLLNCGKAIKKDLLIILLLPKLDGKHRNKAWYKQLDKIGAVIHIKPLSQQHLGQWLKSRLNSYGLTAQWRTIQSLAVYVQGNLVAATQMVEKLFLLYGPSHLTFEQIQVNIEDQSRYTIFQLIDYILHEDIAHVLATLAYLRQEGIQPALIVWMLSHELRTLAKMSYQKQYTHASWSDLFKTFQVWPSRRKLLEKILVKYPSDFFQAHIQKAARIDAVIKGARVANVWDELTSFCLSIAGLRQ